LVIGDPLDFSVAFLGTIACGCWAAPLSPTLPADGPGGLAAAIGRVQADIVFADRAHPGELDVRWIEISGGLERGGPPATDRADGAGGGAVLASSGTTGRPKVIPLQEHQLLHTARRVAEHHRLSPADRGFNPLPLFHINAEVVGLLASLVAGSCLVLDDRFHRTDFWAVMAARRITWINAVPAIVSRLADPGVDESVSAGIRFIRSASAPLPVAVADRFEAHTGIPVVETYGMTEAASQITANPLGVARRPGSVGLPVGVELRIVGGDDPSPDAGAAPGVGHIEIRGPSVITAYGGGLHGDRIDGEGWLRTGDLGHFDADGYVYLDARDDDVINRGGEKVFPREIEEMLLTDPEVAAVAVVGRPDPELGQVPVAFLVLDGGAGEAAAGAARIRGRLRTAMERSRQPVALTVVRDLPLGATGKVNRRALRDGEVPGICHLDCR
jgi:acyl-CoA synthetase (AMP-forming)/AMP-acid ligase II